MVINIFLTEGWLASVTKGFAMVSLMGLINLFLAEGWHASLMTDTHDFHFGIK
jgi:hypothetical protein